MFIKIRKNNENQMLKRQNFLKKKFYKIKI